VMARRSDAFLRAPSTAFDALQPGAAGLLVFGPSKMLKFARMSVFQ
jgi:hypothetical protein